MKIKLSSFFLGMVLTGEFVAFYTKDGLGALGLLCLILIGILYSLEEDR